MYGIFAVNLPRQNGADQMQKITDIYIRYEALSLGEHSIRLDEFSKSLSGFASAIGIAANYAVTGRYEEKQDDWEIVASTDAVIRQGSIGLIATVATLESMATVIKGVTNVKESICGIMNLVFGKGRKGEMSDRDALLEFLEKKDIRDQEERREKEAKDREERLEKDARDREERLKTLELVFAAMQTPAKNALSPIGKACEKIELYAGETGDLIASSDAGIKRALNRKAVPSVSGIRKISAVFVSLDKSTGDCTFVSEEDFDGYDKTRRVKRKGKITDPVFMESSPDPYIRAFSGEEAVELTVKVKESNGTQTYYISDIARQEPDPAPLQGMSADGGASEGDTIE